MKGEMERIRALLDDREDVSNNADGGSVGHEESDKRDDDDDEFDGEVGDCDSDANDETDESPADLHAPIDLIVAASTHYSPPKNVNSELNDIYASVMCAIPRATPCPVMSEFWTPHRHGPQYYYAQLLTKVAWRCSLPSSFISAENVDGSLQFETQLRNIIPPGDELNVFHADMEQRHMTPSRINNHMMTAQEFADVTTFVSKQIDGADGYLPDSVCTPMYDSVEANTTDDDCESQRILANLMHIDGQIPRPDPPHVDLNGVWHTQAPDGSAQQMQLREQQFEAYKLLRHAPNMQLFTFLSGEAGMGKTELLKLLIIEWRSRGYNVIVTASTACAAKHINGVTAHSAFNLDKNGLYRGGIHALTGQWHWLYKADVIIIDEISMLTASALSGINECLCSTMTNTRYGGIQFGGKSVIAVGDLFQLPAVEKYRREDQIWHSPHWARFRLIELTEMVRLDMIGIHAEDNRRLAGVVSRLRVGNLTDDDFNFLSRRLCDNHIHCYCGEQLNIHLPNCNGIIFSSNGTIVQFTGSTDEAFVCGARVGDVVISANGINVDAFHDVHTMLAQMPPPFDFVVTRQAYCTHTFEDVQQIRSPPHTDDTTETVQRTRCDVAPNGIVIASKRAKVNILNDAFFQQHVQVQTREYKAQDTDTNGHKPTAIVSNLITERLSGFLKTLRLFLGQRVVVTSMVNRTVVNGVLGTVEGLHEKHIDVRIDNGGLIAVRRQTSWPVILQRRGEFTRTQFPIIPAHAVTVHRVQGANITSEVHLLLNKEVFAPGQAYVAITRVRNFHQLHFWALQRSALICDPKVCTEYARLRRLPLDQSFLDDETRCKPRIVRHDHELINRVYMQFQAANTPSTTATTTNASMDGVRRVPPTTTSTPRTTASDTRAARVPQRTALGHAVAVTDGLLPPQHTPVPLQSFTGKGKRRRQDI